MRIKLVKELQTHLQQGVESLPRRNVMPCIMLHIEHRGNVSVFPPHSPELKVRPDIYPLV